MISVWFLGVFLLTILVESLHAVSKFNVSGVPKESRDAGDRWCDIDDPIYWDEIGVIGGE